MPAKASSLGHPGIFVRDSIIPPGMSISEAAKRLGVARPTLSNFLNGKSALSEAMAAKLEQAFGADRKRLLNMQTAYQDRERKTEAPVRAFVPSFLTIKARQIEAWADGQLDARQLLPVLLRKLAHSTGKDLRRIDFPGYDNSQRHGSDGIIEAGGATPWVPAGRSYWEFGTDRKPANKAEGDYLARTASIELVERRESTFVFVTPRIWPGKTAWEAKRNGSDDWKAVRVFDASDLEQWLEQSVPAQIWLAEQLEMPVDGYETLEAAWSRWATVSEPPLVPELFSQSIAAYRTTFKKWLDKPSERPFVIAADSRAEALGFLACLFDEEEFQQFKDRTAIFTAAAPLKKLIASQMQFMPIVHSPEVESELADAPRRMHCIVLQPPNAVDIKPDVALDLLSPDAFEAALKAMGMDQNKVERLARESGRSATILRRRLATNRAIMTPAWASRDDIARALIPMTLIGVCRPDLPGDQAILASLADRKHDAVEAEIAQLLGYDDSPVWSAGGYLGVTSKIDALFAIATRVTLPDLERFLEAAKSVLSERDPALDLPERDRWAAAIYGKKRHYSAALHNGICETLVLLSVHGNKLFQVRLGVDVEARIDRLIHDILTPLSSEKLLSQHRDLPHYAEAAPVAFLKIIEKDLQGDEPVLLSLLRPVEAGTFFNSPERTGLLWALECLAWDRRNLSRVVMILARLSGPKLTDNWSNKPEASLQAIFRSWLPQTAASVEDRCRALKQLTTKHPDLGWKICIAQLDPSPQTAHDNYRPHWRGDAAGAGRGVPWNEVHKFCRQALDLLLSRPMQSETSLGALVEALPSLLDEDRAKVWDLVASWSRSANDDAKAALREHIRRVAMTRYARHRNLSDATRDRAREAYEDLQPADPVARHAWLFTEHWVHESWEDIEADDLDFQKRDHRIDQMRREAMTKIWERRGFDGIKQLLAKSNAAQTIGQYVTPSIVGQNLRADFIRNCLEVGGDLKGKIDAFLNGFLESIPEHSCLELIRTMVEVLTAQEVGRLLFCTPFRASTWRLVDELSEQTRKDYWKSASASCFPRRPPAETNEIIDRLLEVQRPRAAFYAVHLNFDDVETSQLQKLLHDVATVGSETAGHHQIERYYVSKALAALDGRVGVSRNEMASLELLYISALEHSEYGIPNLERQVAQSPPHFVEAIGLLYKRSDDGEDPPHWHIEDADRRATVVHIAFQLLNRLARIPGSDDQGGVDETALASWIDEVRRLCHEHGRADIGDQCIGQLLAKAPLAGDGMWPCEAVCAVMEGIGSSEIALGFQTGVYNSRGAVWRGPRGEQERELVAKYRAMGERLSFEYPYMANVLEEIAKFYERDALRWDGQENLSKRLRF